MLLLEIILVGGLLLLPLQAVKLSIAQPAHLWVLIALVVMLFYERPRLSGTELIAYAAFVYFTLALTFMQDYTRIKEMDQLVKFVLFIRRFMWWENGWDGTSVTVRCHWPTASYLSS